MERNPQAAFFTGDRVALIRLKVEKYNETIGYVTGFDEATQRFLVKLQDGKCLKVRARNLTLALDAPIAMNILCSRIKDSSLPFQDFLKALDKLEEWKDSESEFYARVLGFATNQILRALTNDHVVMGKQLRRLEIAADLRISERAQIDLKLKIADYLLAFNRHAEAKQLANSLRSRHFGRLPIIVDIMGRCAVSHEELVSLYAEIEDMIKSGNHDYRFEYFSLKGRVIRAMAWTGKIQDAICELKEMKMKADFEKDGHHVLITEGDIAYILGKYEKSDVIGHEKDNR